MRREAIAELRHGVRQFTSRKVSAASAGILTHSLTHSATAASSTWWQSAECVTRKSACMARNNRQWTVVLPIRKQQVLGSNPSVGSRLPGTNSALMPRYRLCTRRRLTLR
jgi:hypothetical protein